MSINQTNFKSVFNEMLIKFLVQINLKVNDLCEKDWTKHLNSIVRCVASLFKNVT